MKYSKDTILRNAFDVFMERGYENTSISVLQKELNMSRGALYCYFKNKEDLFCSVIDQYFFRMYNKISQHKSENMTVPELIEYVYRRQRLTIYLFGKEDFTHDVFLNYTDLLIQAAKHYPGFIQKYKVLRGLFMNKWKIALENSLKRDEIKADTNISMICRLFNSVFSRETSDECYDDSAFASKILEDVDNRKHLLDYLYSLIKK